MGNTGRPSYGCQNCKKAHMKCDEASPACTLCTRRRQNCLYPDFFDITFRDETDAVKARLGRWRGRTRQERPGKRVTLESTSDQDLTSKSMQPQIVSLRMSPEQHAIAVWYSQYGDQKCKEESPTGFMEYVHSQMLAAAKPNSPLERAIYALALFTFQHTVDVYVDTTESFFQLGRMVLGQALRLTSKAIQDHEACRSDETLMAVLILGIIEALLCMLDGRVSPRIHFSAAARLISLRGEKNFQTAASRGMLAAVHAGMVRKALCRSVAVQQFTVGFYSDEWVDRLSQYPSTPSIALTCIAERIANVHAFAKAACPSALDDKQASALLAIILNIDQELLDWRAALPDSWRIRSASDLSAANLAKFRAYGVEMDVYESIWVANGYNDFRILRLSLQWLIHTIVSHFRLEGTHFLPFGPPVYIHTTECLIDEVCASVPFFLGTRAPGLLSAKIQFPTAEDVSSSPADSNLALRVGTWLLGPPLNMCLRYAPMKGRQRMWIEAQMRRIDSSNAMQRLSQGKYEGTRPVCFVQ